MNHITSFSLNIVWVALLALTGLTAWVSDIDGGTHWPTTIILLVASLKIGLVMLYFMELKLAPRAWQCAYAVWVAAVSAVLVLGFIAV